MNQVSIHACAACPIPDGPGAFAAILDVKPLQVIIHGGDPSTTQRRMEFTALIQALRFLKLQNVPPGTLVSLNMPPNPITNLLQTTTPDRAQNDYDLQVQLLADAATYSLSFLPENEIPDAPDLTAHCQAMAQSQIEPTVKYQIPWSTASMPLAPITQEIPSTPPPPNSEEEKPGENDQAPASQPTMLLLPEIKLAH